MGKQHITETLVCGNCIHSSPIENVNDTVVWCNVRTTNVHIHSTFCTSFQAKWVIDDDRHIFESMLDKVEWQNSQELIERIV